MPLIVRYAEIAGLDSEESASARDIGTREFLSLSTDVWAILEPEFSAKSLSIFETFPGEHLGGKLVAKVPMASDAGSRVLRRLEPRDRLTQSEVAPGVHSNNSIEVVGTLSLVGMPTMLAVLQINIYRAWSTGSKDWPGAGDLVFDVTKTAGAQFDGLWEAFAARREPMLPYLEKWVAGIVRVSHSKGGRHRIQWAALRETSDASGPPISGAPLLYRSRGMGRPSLVAANLRAEARRELLEPLSTSADAFRRSEVRDAIDAEVISMTGSGAFAGVADAFQANSLVQYTPAGSEAFVFRDPDGPEKAAREIVSAVRGTLVERVRARLGETKLWDQALHRIKPVPHQARKTDASLDNY